MPIYEYIAVEGGCDACRDGFDIMQRMSDEPLTTCPHCGGAVRKAVSRVNIGRNVLGTANLKDKGFTKLVKKEKGVYEKVT